MDDSVDDETVAGMVEACRSDWTVEGFERSDHGTDLVCLVTCRTPEGSPIVSSDSAYDDVAERVPLEENDG